MKLAIIFALLIITLYFVYRSVYEGLFIVPQPLFNFGTREWYPTRNMSYDIRGEPVISYYGVGPFYQPEYPFRYGYGFVGGFPPQFQAPYSVPFAVNNNNKK
jgi:hypothetical protein